MNLKQIARSHTTHDGAVTWWMTPYRTLKKQAVAREVAKLLPKDQWGPEQTAFITFEGDVVDLEFAGKLTPELERLRLYWSERPVSIAERQDAFLVLFSDSLADALFEAYSATRDTVLEAQGTDPEVSAAAAKQS